MNRTVWLAILAGALTIPAARAQRIEERKEAQQARIWQGVRSGELTRREALRLERQERQLNREIRRDRRDGGGLTAGERARIERKQDRMSRRIAREKHDAQTRR
jgi:hypothetical protein